MTSKLNVNTTGQPPRARLQIERIGSHLALVLAIGVLLGVYFQTLQTEINGSAHGYTLDTGEIQVALNLWGTVHYTGYPLYTILSTLVTRLLVMLGAVPAAAASATSLIWSILALVSAHRLLVALLKGSQVLAALVILALGVSETFWLHSVVSEVYSFSILLVSLVLLLSEGLRTRQDSRRWLLTLFLIGTAGAHHRVLLILGPMVALWTAPHWGHWLRHNSLKHLLYATVALAAPFAAYLYLPLRAWQNARWVYGQPGTWHGFWQQFSGSEVTGALLRLPADRAGWLANGHFLLDSLLQQAPWPFWLLGVAGLLWLATVERSVGLSLLLGATGLLGFVLLFPQAVWVAAMLMPVLLCLAVGLAFLLQGLTRLHPLAAPLGWLGLLLLAGYLFVSNRSFVLGLTRDASGRQMIEILQALPHHGDTASDRPTVAIPWGKDYFAAAYGAYVTGEVTELVLVDHRADFAAILARDGAILTPAAFLHFWPPATWEATVGDVAFAAVTPDIIAVRQPRYASTAASATDFALGNGIRIRSARLTGAANSLTLTLVWEALQPIERDYSVAVHLLQQYPPAAPGDLLAQADASHPVQGWYPTTQWAVGEIVADSYRLAWDPQLASNPQAVVAVSMYYVNAAGDFVNSERMVLRLPSAAGTQ